MSIFFTEEGTLHHGEKRSMRESSDPVSRAHNASGIANGPSNGQMNILNVKVKSSNISTILPDTFSYPNISFVRENKNIAHLLKVITSEVITFKRK